MSLHSWRPHRHKTLRLLFAFVHDANLDGVTRNHSLYDAFSILVVVLDGDVVKPALECTLGAKQLTQIDWYRDFLIRLQNGDVRASKEVHLARTGNVDRASRHLVDNSHREEHRDRLEDVEHRDRVLGDVLETHPEGRRLTRPLRPRQFVDGQPDSDISGAGA